MLSPTYNQTSILSSSEELRRATREIHDGQSLWGISKRAARGVHFRGLALHEVWDTLLIASIVAGIPQAVAQECIGRVFAHVRHDEAMS